MSIDNLIRIRFSHKKNINIGLFQLSLHQFAIESVSDYYRSHLNHGNSLESRRIIIATGHISESQNNHPFYVYA